MANRRKLVPPTPEFTPPRGRCRFVVLHHILEEGSHYDLMMEWAHSDDENEYVLRTWSTEEDRPPGEDMVLTLKADHRKIYLGYQGPVPAAEEGEPDRGIVERTDAGIFRVLEDKNDEGPVIRFMGRVLRGSFVFQPYVWVDNHQQVRLRSLMEE